MAKLFPNCLYVVGVLALVGLFSSFWTGSIEMFQKDAFNYNVGFAAGCFSLTMVFIRQMKAKGSRWSTALNLNVIMVITAGVLCVAVGLVFNAASVAAEGAGALVGLAYNTVLGGGIGVAMALAGRDNEDSVSD